MNEVIPAIERNNKQTRLPTGRLPRRYASRNDERKDKIDSASSAE